MDFLEDLELYNSAMENAYDIIQKAAIKSLNSNKKFEHILSENREIKKHLKKDNLKDLLSSENKIKHINKIFKKAFK